MGAPGYTSGSPKINADQQDPNDHGNVLVGADRKRVRRQGLEPRTRWLRARSSPCRDVPRNAA
jgi:hypothetical protein